MNRYLGRILICTVPVLIGIAIIAWAGNQYANGEGGFRLGVDLVGGTILVYEVDLTKVQGGKNNYKPDEMTTALKRRVDPNDLLNVTIRALPGDPPRVEVILPTGGRHQSEIEDKAWRELLQEVAKKYPPPPGKSYNAVGTLSDVELIDKIKEYHPDVEVKNPDEIGGLSGGAARAALKPRTDITEIQEFIKANYHGPKGARGLTHERIEEIKGLISQQGRLEFRILANSTDDGEAIRLAKEYFANPANKSDLETRARNDDPPPGPRQPDNEPFIVTLGGESTRHYYSWVELGKEELYSLHRSGARRAGRNQRRDFDL
jgi:preprotein translocase subunit SecD